MFILVLKLKIRGQYLQLVPAHGRVFESGFNADQGSHTHVLLACQLMVVLIISNASFQVLLLPESSPWAPLSLPLSSVILSTLMVSICFTMQIIHQSGFLFLYSCEAQAHIANHTLNPSILYNMA